MVRGREEAARTGKFARENQVPGMPKEGHENAELKRWLNL
jgi:hypothetical protein